MKKILSFLMAFLILIGSIPVQFAKAEATAESLPANMFSGYKSPSAKTITASTNITVGGSYVAGTAASLSLQWGKADGSGNNGDTYSPINAGYYQLDFDLIVSEDINSGAYLYPEFHSNAAIYGMTDLVGVRYLLDLPGDVVTAHNYINTTSGTVKPSAANSAELKAGSYRCTYIFNSPKEQNINIILVIISGLTSGSVKIENANIFSLASTDWAEFYYKPTELVHFMVEENGNVFQRIYGYRAVGDNSTGARRSLSAKVGGKFYDLYFKGGNTYNLDFDFRFPKGSASIGDLKYAPLVDFYETRTLDYANEYSSIKESANSTADDSFKYIVQTVTSGVTQITYKDNENGYSYFYAAAGQSTRLRRINSSSITAFNYSDDEGKVLYSASSKTSALGRDAKNDTDIATNNNWLNGAYSIKAPQAQSIYEAYLTAKSQNSTYTNATRYILSETDNTTWVYQSSYNSYFVPSEQNAYVALGIGYLYSGFVYDFDNIAVTGNFDEELPIKYENIDGSENTVSASTGNTAVLIKNNNGTLTAKLDFCSFGGSYIFKGWYENGELFSSDIECTFNAEDVDTSCLVAVIITLNVLEGDPGFEGYNDGETMRVQPTMQNTAPYSDKWGLYSSYSNSKGDAGYENGDWPWTVKAFSGTVTDYYLNDVYDSESDTTTSTKIEYTVAPYEGNGMLGAAVKSRSMIRKLQNLTPNTQYSVSFYVNYPSQKDYIKTVVVADTYNGYSGGELDETLTKIYSTYTELDDYVVDADKIRNWGKISLNFTTDEDDTELYLHISFTSKNTDTASSRIYIDNLVCTPNIIGYTGNAIRAAAKELPQALRYKFYMNNAHLESFMDMQVKEIGLLAMDSSYLGENELVIDGEYEADGEIKRPSVGIVNESNLQSVTGDTKNSYFTAALYNIGRNGGSTNYGKYATDFSVRPYIKLQGENSAEIIYYGATVNSCIFDVIRGIYTEFSSQGDIAVADEILSVEMAKNEYKNWEPKYGFFKFKDEVTDYDYSFAVVGDPQVTTGYYPEYMHYTYDWIVDNKNDKNIQYVITLGDLTQNSTDSEYAVIEEGIKNVHQAGIYQAILRGNHDTASSYDKNITQAEYGSYLNGSYDSTMKNTYHIVTIGGTKYLILNLDYYPTTAMVDWAAGIVEANSDCRVIVNTHGLLNYDMSLLTHSAVTYMHDNLILKYKNIAMVLCGHHEADGPKYKTVTGQNGNKIVEMMINPQGLESRTEQAYGFVATLYFKNDGKTVEVEYYSTVRKAYFKEEYQFSFQLN